RNAQHTTIFAYLRSNTFVRRMSVAERAAPIIPPLETRASQRPGRNCAPSAAADQHAHPPARRRRIRVVAHRQGGDLEPIRLAPGPLPQPECVRGGEPAVPAHVLTNTVRGTRRTDADPQPYERAPGREVPAFELTDQVDRPTPRYVPG